MRKRSSRVPTRNERVLTTAVGGGPLLGPLGQSPKQKARETPKQTGRLHTCCSLCGVEA